jgi:hypothetical protein
MGYDTLALKKRNAPLVMNTVLYGGNESVHIDIVIYQEISSFMYRYLGTNNNDYQNILKYRY